MKKISLFIPLFALLALGALSGCKSDPQKSPDVSDSIRKSLDSAGLKSVSVSDDRDQGIITISGQVDNDGQKSQAESVAKSLSGGQVVADQVAVIPPGTAKDVSAINADLDQAIERNYDAALIQNKMHSDVNYGVKIGVITLTGDVSSEDERSHAEQLATAVPNVHQVVNDIHVVNDRKASTVTK